MIVSRAEISSVLRSAAWGAGWPWGLAEEIGRAGVALVASGHDGVGIALAAIRTGYLPAAARRVPEGWRFGEVRAGAAGPSVYDLLAIGDDRAKVMIAGLDEPLLVAGAGAVAAARDHRAYAIRFDGGGRAAIDVGIHLHPPHPGPGEGAVISRAAIGSAGVGMAAGEHPELVVEDAQWERAILAASASHVPSTAVSRQRGAGAEGAD